MIKDNIIIKFTKITNISLIGLTLAVTHGTNLRSFVYFITQKKNPTQPPYNDGTPNTTHQWCVQYKVYEKDKEKGIVKEVLEGIVEEGLEGIREMIEKNFLERGGPLFRNSLNLFVIEGFSTKIMSLIIVSFTLKMDFLWLTKTTYIIYFGLHSY